ncbi:hypothetical protein L3X38_006318 [Prunus dulcis]|uniref:Uncharacterized protein n=1 Tax=Prunus dulcis TaxID=3755 RepID=A0AAD4ZSG1_PRUDU|nr:hypothetical protein L3X38_006318 [Prunus dulcis]
MASMVVPEESSSGVCGYVHNSLPFKLVKEVKSTPVEKEIVQPLDLKSVWEVQETGPCRAIGVNIVEMGVRARAEHGNQELQQGPNEAEPRHLRLVLDGVGIGQADSSSSAQRHIASGGQPRGLLSGNSLGSI